MVQSGRIGRGYRVQRQALSLEGSVSAIGEDDRMGQTNARQTVDEVAGYSVSDQLSRAAGVDGRGAWRRGRPNTAGGSAGVAGIADTDPCASQKRKRSPASKPEITGRVPAFPAPIAMIPKS